MKEIQLTHGKVSQVDDDVPDIVLRVKDLKWHAICAKSGVWHATTTLVLHRIIMDAPQGKVVDHINRDGLYNLRENLKITTTMGTAANRAQAKSSQYMGVTKVKRKKGHMWRAYYTAPGGKYVCVGHFKDEDTAAHMRDEAVKDALGEQAELNFPEQGSTL